MTAGNNLETDYKQKTSRPDDSAKYNWLKLTLYSILVGSASAYVNQSNDIGNRSIKIRRDGNTTLPELHSKVLKGQNAGVASEHGTCSQIGVDILKKEGSAVDSTIATALCIGVLNGFSSGIGGGGFSVIRTPDGEVEFVDFRESAPLLANKTMYEKDPIKSQVGGLAVGVPGEIRGFELMHSKYGKLPWKDLFLPSIELCECGFSAGAELVKRLNLHKNWILKNEQFKEIYAPNGTLIVEGDLIYRHGLGSTLTRISEEGAEAFYEGEIAQEVVDFIHENGGILSLEDLKNYKALTREPAVGTFFNSTVISSSAPSAGSILVSTLELLESVVKTNGTGSKIDLYHKFVEILKFGFASRTKIGDPDFNKNITKYSQEIITKEYIDNLRKKVDLEKTHGYLYYDPLYAPKELPGTTHISVIDKDGQVVSLTSTVNLEFGSQTMTPKSGIILNNEMDDFSSPGFSNGFDLAPSPYNWIEPNKRPLSSTVPTILVKPNGEIICLGGSGGSRILSAVAQILFEMELDGKDIGPAVDNARIHDQLLPETIYVEQNFDQTILDGLQAKGHNITKWDSYKSIVQLVKKHSNGTIEALSDARKNGLAAVY